MFESCLRNTKARFSGFFLCCLGWTLHMLPVAVLCKQSVASNDYESCLRNKKKRELFKTHVSIKSHKVSTSFCSLLSQNTFEFPEWSSPFHRSKNE